MSTTMIMTLPPKSALRSTGGPGTATVTSSTATTTTENDPCCPNCGFSLPSPSSDPHTALLEAQRQIEDLQGQVRLLNEKAAAAVDRWADYEDELSRLRAASLSTTTTTTATTATTATTTTTSSTKHANGNTTRPITPDPSTSTNTSSPRSSFLGAGAASRISQLLSPRRSTPVVADRHHSNNSSSPTPPPPPPPPPPPEAAQTRELIAALAQERRLRTAAEEKLAETSREIEDLSASLFEEANTMVAAERKARAELEERVNLLETRDREKGERLSRLEGAVRRIERVRGLLADKSSSGVDGEREVGGETDAEADAETLSESDFERSIDDDYGSETRRMTTGAGRASVGGRNARRESLGGG